MVAIVVMLVGLLTFIIFSELNYDDKNEKIFKDFFRFFRKIDPHSDDIALTFCELDVQNVSENLTKDRFPEKKTCHDNSLCKRCVWKYNGGCSEWPG